MENRISLNEIIARKKQGKMDRLSVAYYNSQLLGGEIEIRKIPIRRFMELQEIVEDDYIEGMAIIIFELLPMFKEDTKEAMELYKVKTQSDLVLAVFEDNVGEMTDIMNEINKLYGIKDEENLSDEIEKEVKN